MISCKRTKTKNVDLVTMIEEACRFAEREDLVPGVALRLEALAEGIERDWAVVSLRTLSALLHSRSKTRGSDPDAAARDGSARSTQEVSPDE